MTALDKHAEDHPPNVRIMTDLDRAASQKLSPQISQLEKQLAEHRKTNETSFKKWYDAKQKSPKLDLPRKAIIVANFFIFGVGLVVFSASAALGEARSWFFDQFRGC